MTRNKRERYMSFCRNTGYFVTMMINKLVKRKADRINFSSVHLAAPIGNVMISLFVALSTGVAPS